MEDEFQVIDHKLYDGSPYGLEESEPVMINKEMVTSELGPKTTPAKGSEGSSGKAIK